MNLSDIKNMFRFNTRNRTVSEDTFSNAAKSAKLPSELIVPKSVNNGRQYMIRDWVSAVAAATNPDNPNRSLLYALYDKVMLDLHISALLLSRVEPVTRAKFKIVKANTKENDSAMAEILDMNWFEDFIGYALESRFYGYSLMELNQFNDLQNAFIKLIPRAHVDPAKEIIKIEVSDTTGYSYVEKLKPYYIGAGKYDSLGLLYKITPVFLAINYAYGMWNEFNEKMVIPFRTLKTPSRDKNRHRLLGTILQEMGSAGWAVLNDDEVLELTEISGKDAYKAFDTLIERLENKITRLVLGQTATTNQDGTGTYGSLKILAEVAKDRHESDKTFIKRLVNTELIPRLIQFGQPLTNMQFEWDDSIEQTTEQKIDIINKISQNYMVAPKYVTEFTGIPVTAKQFVNVTADGKQKKKSDNLSIFEKIRNYYQGNPTMSQSELPVFDFFNDAETDRILKAVHDGTIKKDMLDAESYLTIANSLFSQVTKGFGQSLEKLNYDHPDRNLMTYMRANVFKFSAAKNLKQFQEISSKLLDENGNIKPFNTFKKDVLSIYENYNKTWLETEYQNALAQSQSAAMFADAMRTKDLYDLQYVTAGDERVRKEHKQYNGITLPVDDGFWNKHLPPNGWKCRCKFRKVAKGTPNSSVEKLKEVPKPEKGFAFNPATEKQVFNESKHPYFDKIDFDKISAVDTYGMRTVETIYSRPEKLPARKADWSQEEFKEEWERLAKEATLEGKPNSFIIETKLKDKLLFDDDLKNKILTLKKNEERWKIANNLNDIVTKPDEVWTGLKSGVNQGDALVYIKYYNDKALVVYCNLVGDQVIRVSSFYEIKKLTNSGHLSDLRSGVLLYRK